MKHYGDITKLSGYELPVVDVITGGSPCQDLSVAGKRKGLKHSELGDEETTRSGLFMDQMRIVREMRERDRANGRTGVLVRPRFMVWENVDGCRTSPGGEHRGEDYAAVIEEIIRVAEPDADIHVRVPDGGWPNAGCYYAEDGAWSLAWRLVDAQYFGTPQRRVRVALLADFGGLAAPEILFDPQLERATEAGEPIEAVADTASGGCEVSAQSTRMQRDTQPGEPPREGTSARTEGGFGSAGKCLNGWDIQSKHIQPTDGIAESLYAGECRYGGGESYLLDVQDSTSYTLKIRGGVDIDSAGKRAGKGPLVQTELSGTLGVSQDQTLIQTGVNEEERDSCVMSAGFSFGQSAKARSLGYEIEKSPTIRGGEGGNQKPVVLAVDCRNGTEDPEINGTLQAKSNGGYNYNSNNVVRETATPYGICSFESNAFKSSNPHSAIYEADTSRTLDNNGGNPSCNQGGIAIVEKTACYPIEGNGARPSHFGKGYGNDGDPSFTLNHVEQHGVATYDARGNGDGNIACTLTGDHQDRVTDYTALVLENDSTGKQSEPCDSQGN